MKTPDLTPIKSSYFEEIDEYAAGISGTLQRRAFLAQVDRIGLGRAIEQYENWVLAMMRKRRML